LKEVSASCEAWPFPRLLDRCWRLFPAKEGKVPGGCGAKRRINAENTESAEFAEKRKPDGAT